MNSGLTLNPFTGTLVTISFLSLEINRSIPFGVGLKKMEGWRILEEDPKSAQLTVVDLSKVRIAKTGHGRVLERIEYLKASPFIRADAKIFEALWHDQNLLSGLVRPDSNIGHISFEGTIFTNGRSLGVIEMIHRDREWTWHMHRLAEDGSATSYSVVIET